LNKVITYFREYFSAADKKQLIIVSGITASVIFINYYFGIEKQVSACSFPVKYLAWVGIFFITWLLPYAIVLSQRTFLLKEGKFLAILCLAPLLFALKITLAPSFHLTADNNWNQYWNHLLYWPFLLLIIGLILFITGRIFHHDQPFYGSRFKGMDWRPYYWMLLIMIPLITLAATQPDFQAMYPKLQNIHGLFPGKEKSWWQKLLFELSYGTDFISIEFFFRGFLVLAFVKWVGKDAILPMACFYCSVHFGKPLGECISSYFGGMLLGIVVYNTRSIFGGLMVHLGIAWLMEIAGYLVN
jgi:hypothetical protein